MTDQLSERRIAILGTGEFGRALGTRLLQFGVPFCYGSRQPARKPTGQRKEALERGTMKTIDEACLQSDIIILALHRRHYELLSRFGDRLQDKILVDVSNEQDDPSTDRLAAMLPKCAVVKAFNTVSARAMSLGGPARPVYVCADDEAARTTILGLATRVGFSAIDYGPLRNGVALERSVGRLFPGWGWPCLVVIVVAVFWLVFTACRAFKLRRDPYSPDRLPTNVVNKVVGAIAATCLSLVFLPGCLVAAAQLVTGAKHVELPRLLDGWLTIRQRLGLFALLLAALHMVLSLVLVSPAYFPHWYPPIERHLSANDSYAALAAGMRMTWIGETVMLLGALAMIVLVLLGISTLPSIAGLLVWREWRFIHTHLGFVCLLLTTCHILMKGAPLWLGKSAKDVIPTVAFLSALLLWITVGFKIVLYMPCLYQRVDRIRSGQLSNSSDPVEPSGQDDAKSKGDHNVDDLSVVV